jgi:tyrosine-protein phosphatase YwqE
VLGADFDNDSAFMNDVVVPWCREQKIEVTRSRAYKKNDQAFVEQKNGAVVRRLVGYGRFEGIDTARVLVRLYAASRLHTNFFQPSFKLKDKRREGAKVIKRYHAPATPYARALAHPKLSKVVKQRLRELYRTLDPVLLLAEMRDAQTELGARVDCRAGKIAAAPCTPPPAPDAAAFAKGLGKAVLAGEQRAIHRRLHKPYKKRVRMPSMLDPHVEEIDRWLAAERRLTALAILGRLAARCPGQFGPPQHTIVQRYWLPSIRGALALARKDWKAAVSALEAATSGALELSTGCDFHLSYDNIQDAIANPRKYTINGGNYLLVEFSDLLIPRTTDDVFYQMQSAGMIPNITHPERNMLLQKRLDKLEDWAKSGCLVQVTALSLLGRFGKQANAFADLLLERDLVHIVASDAHDTKYRPPSLKDAYDYVSKRYGPDRAERLFAKNPGAVITGTPIETYYEPPAPVKKWYQFWN